VFFFFYARINNLGIDVYFVGCSLCFFVECNQCAVRVCNSNKIESLKNRMWIDYFNHLIGFYVNFFTNLFFIDNFSFFCWYIQIEEKTNFSRKIIKKSNECTHTQTWFPFFFILIQALLSFFVSSVVYYVFFFSLSNRLLLSLIHGFFLK